MTGEQRRPPPKSLNVAAVTMSCHQDPEANLRKITDTVGSIMGERPDTQLVVFGEMILGWYDPEDMPEYHRRISLQTSHDSLGPVSKMASDFGIYISMGFSEMHEGIIHNSQLLFDRLGNLRAVHRKHNLKPAEIRCGYHPGVEGFTMTRIMGLKTVLAICSDLASLETIRRLSWKRPDLIILSLADDSDPGFLMARCNARIYDSWIVTANRFGLEDDRVWEGHTVISSPWGRLEEASTGRETVLFHQLGFPSRKNLPLRLLRKLIVRAPLPFIVLANRKRLHEYFQR
ncbi:MAG: carbon-nitrogen hydrolase family protein [Candidatus Fermentibacteraceae bacterium]|nr:carbon-nitrogen hydrolase family protein [Candidatus Fermentibacteraceae bacterium]